MSITFYLRLRCLLPLIDDTVGLIQSVGNKIYQKEYNVLPQITYNRRPIVRFRIHTVLCHGIFNIMLYLIDLSGIDQTSSCIEVQIFITNFTLLCLTLIWGYVDPWLPCRDCNQGIRGCNGQEKSISVSSFSRYGYVWTSNVFLTTLSN